MKSDRKQGLDLTIQKSMIRPLDITKKQHGYTDIKKSRTNTEQVNTIG